MGTFDIAQIYLNGHVVNDRVRGYTEFNKKFCSSCGAAATITSCSECNTLIKGKYVIPNVISASIMKAPRFCENCGKPYPLTERRQKAAEELIEFSELEEQEKEDLKGSVANLVEGGAKTSLAILKVKKYIGKAGTALGNGLKDILKDVISETVKKAIWSS